MLNPDFELDRLRWSLEGKGWLPDEVDRIVDLAAEEINNIILDVVSNASATAISHAEIIGAQEFVFDIDIAQEGFLYFIKTKSGKTDYSIPRTENLPNLLKNGKPTKDGGKYKVIPLRDKKPKVGLSSFETMQNQQRIQDAARTVLIENNKDNRSARANQMADQFRQELARTVSARQKHAEAVGAVSFRTASSKQDPKSQWVIPEIDRDMTQYLLDLNDRIKDTVEDAVTVIINSYQQEYG
jgi:predicted RNA binding protein with dsRBD fold (UPF0201 family)